MNRRILVLALTVASLAFSGLTIAQERDGRQGRNDRQGEYARGDQNGDRGGQQDQRGYRGQQNNRGDQAGRDDERGAGPDHGAYRGSRLPNQYRDRGDVVDDWRGHQLSAPPLGYHWVQTGGGYVLVAIATGVIAQILLGQ